MNKEKRNFVINAAIVTGFAVGIGSVAIGTGAYSKETDRNATPQEDQRYAELVVLHRSLQDEFPFVPDQVHYSFTSPICPGRWEGTAENYVPPKIRLFFPEECDENIPLVGVLTPHYPGCRPTRYSFTAAKDGTLADLVVKTVLQGPAQRSYAHINCEKIQD